MKKCIKYPFLKCVSDAKKCDSCGIEKKEEELREGDNKK